MSCTRRKESRLALVIGAAGAEVRQKMPWGLARFTLPGDAPRLEQGERGGLVLRTTPAPVEWSPFDHGVEITMSVLPPDATPAELYS